MNNKNQIITFKETNQLQYKDVSIDSITEYVKNMGDGLDRLGIITATFINGDHYKNDIVAGIKTFASKGLIVEEKHNTYNITILKEGYNEKGVINELEETKTQNIIGSFTNNSQSKVSNIKNQK